MRKTRELKDRCVYNIISKEVYLLEESERIFEIKGTGQANVWYGNPEFDRKVVDYTKKYENVYDSRISDIDAQLVQLQGEEREAW